MEVGEEDSRKPGNLTLNWSSALELTTGAALTIVGLAAVPLLLPLAALNISAVAWKATAKDISPEHALALVTMWQHRDGQDSIAEDDAYELLKQQLAQWDLRAVLSREFGDILDDLAELHCVTLAETECDSEGTGST